MNSDGKKEVDVELEEEGIFVVVDFCVVVIEEKLIQDLVGAHRMFLITQNFKYK